MNETCTFEVTPEVGRKGVWKISLAPEALTLAAEDGSETIQIARADAQEKTELRESRLIDPHLVVSFPKQKIIFKLERAQAASLKKWLGPPTFRALKVALGRRLRFSLPIGILFVVTSLPLPADPEAGLEAVPFDAVSAFLGISLIMLSILTRIWPHRGLFLLDGVWFSLLALDVAMGVFHGDSPWWGILVFVLILVAKGGFSEYQRFASVSYENAEQSREPVRA